MSTLGPGDVEAALAAYGPLTDVWSIKAVTASNACTVVLENPAGAVPYVGASLQKHYVGALVRFTTGVLSGAGNTIGYGAFNTTISAITSATNPALTTVTFGDDFPTPPNPGDTFTVIRAAGVGTAVTTTVSTGNVTIQNASLPVTPYSGSVWGVQAANGTALPVSLSQTVTVSPASSTVWSIQPSGGNPLPIAGNVGLVSGQSVQVTNPSGGLLAVTGQTANPLPNVRLASNNLPGGASNVGTGTLGIVAMGSVPTTATDFLTEWPHNTIAGLFGSVANVGSVEATLTLTLTNTSNTAETLTLTFPVPAGDVLPIAWTFPFPLLLFATAASLTVSGSASVASTLEADVYLLGL